MLPNQSNLNLLNCKFLFLIVIGMKGKSAAKWRKLGNPFHAGSTDLLGSSANCAVTLDCRYFVCFLFFCWVYYYITLGVISVCIIFTHQSQAVTESIIVTNYVELNFCLMFLCVYACFCLTICTWFSKCNWFRSLILATSPMRQM